MPRVVRRRARNRDVNGRRFAKDVIDKVWERGKKILFRDPTMYRRDIVGNVIYRRAYGKESPMGWEIDHKKPVSKGGTDHLNNLQPLQSAANAEKGDQYPWPR